MSGQRPLSARLPVDLHAEFLEAMRQRIDRAREQAAILRKAERREASPEESNPNPNP